MKTLQILALAAASTAFAQTKVSITAFKDNVADSNCRYGGHWQWWRGHMSSAFKELLISELKKQSKFQVLERAQINAIHEGEHNLVNSENSARPPKGKFKIANYTLAGAVTELEICGNEGGGEIDVGRMLGVGSITFGGRAGSAKAAVEIRVIKVSTGEVVHTASGESTINDSTFNFGVAPVGIKFDVQQNSPMGKAARAAIANAVKDIVSQKL